MADKSSIEQDKQRSDLLKKQLIQMNQDYQFMKKNKEEWKKQLDARFQDIERKIQNSRQYITNEAKRTNDTLLAFQHKFEHELTNNKDTLQNNIDQLRKQTTENFTTKSQDIKKLNQELLEQKKQRQDQHHQGIKDMTDRFEKTNESIQKQKQHRIKNEKQNMGKLNESIYLIKEQLKQEKSQRLQKLNQLQKNTDYELSSQRKFNEQFHNKTYNDFKTTLNELKNEMQTRLSSKDEIINSLSKVVKTLQDTLRYPT